VYDIYLTGKKQVEDRRKTTRVGGNDTRINVKCGSIYGQTGGGLRFHEANHPEGISPVAGLFPRLASMDVCGYL
jgi:hypothetical protein